MLSPSTGLVTTILDTEQAPASELAALYHERWEVETALDELKTHPRGSKMVMRSKMPELIMRMCWLRYFKSESHPVAGNEIPAESDRK